MTAAAAAQPVRVLLTGPDGQLGQQLRADVPEGVELILCARSELDLADADACVEAVRRHRPDWVLNSGAYTAVDRAESEVHLARAVNTGAPQAFARALAQQGGRLLQLSTDFVFAGDQGHPYRPEQEHRPLSVYGISKAEAERCISAELAPDRFCVLRTSWVYGPVGRNFCLTMLELHRRRAAAGEPLRVVADQVGCPTATYTLARACWAAIQRGVSGVHHWSDAGAASWYDFAVAIGELGVTTGLLQRSAGVEPIPASEYPTPARRPSYSLLDTSASRLALDLPLLHWRGALAEVLRQRSRLAAGSS
jgi:dTDP-4-dehydrorhamnose reductase